MTQSVVDLPAALERDGFAVVADVLSRESVEELLVAIATAQASSAALRRDGETYGMRDLLRNVPEVRRLARSPALLDLAGAVLGPSAFAVRCLWFDKTDGANWGVPWHQDTTIAVRERVDTPGFGPWTIKAGISHVRPPASVLSGMVTLRVHLDDCHADNGPLQVIPGSYALGRLDAETTADWLTQKPHVPCLIDRGGVILMRPLILHSSSAADVPRHRRVVHIEYACRPLPGGLHWFECVRSSD